MKKKFRLLILLLSVFLLTKNITADFLDLSFIGYTDDQVNGIRWHPDEKFLAMGGGGGDGHECFEIHSFDGNSLTEVAEIDSFLTVYNLAWSPSGRYIAIAGAVDDTYIYEWDGANLTQKDSVTAGSDAYGLSWFPDGSLLAVAAQSNDPDDIIIYNWNGSNLTERTTKDFSNAVSNIEWLEWSPDGRFLAAGGDDDTNKEQLVIYEWNGSSLTMTTSKHHESNRTCAPKWSHDGQYLAVSGGKLLIIYQWDGSTLTNVFEQYFSQFLSYVDWDPSGKILALATQSGGSKQVYTYHWDGIQLTELATRNHVGFASFVEFSPSGLYFSVGGQNDPNDGIIYKRTGAVDGIQNNLYYGKLNQIYSAYICSSACYAQL